MHWLFTTFILRQLVRHPGLSLLNITGIALGVAVFLSIQIANQSSLNAFRGTLDVVAGRSQLEITGNNGRFDENIFRTVTSAGNIHAVTPTIEEVCAVMPDNAQNPESATPLTFLRILGLDLFSNAPFRPLDFKDQNAAATGTPSPALESFIKDPLTICITESMAKRLGVHTGESLSVLAGQKITPLKIVAIFSPDETALGTDEHLAVMDIAHAQELFDATGSLTRIDIRVADGLKGSKLRDALEEVREQIAPLLPPDVSIGTPDRRGAKVEKMLWAFQLNLTALSLLSLVVGMFLIYNSMTTSVVRRRTEIGILRASGMTATQVQALILSEAAIQGVIGVLAGWFLGLFIAEGLTGAVAQTIRSLYLTVSIQSLHIPWWLYPVTFVTGMGAVLLSAWIPAREAAQVAPVESLSTAHLHQKSLLQSGKQVERGLIICVISGLSALGALYFYPPLGFVSALTLVLGVAFFCPAFLKATCQNLSRACMNRGWLLPALAARQIAHALNRTSVAVAALMAALSMMVGVSIMIHSFRVTVDDWINQTVKADLVVSPSSQLLVGTRATLPLELIDHLRADPRIRLVDTYSERKMTFRGQTIKTAGVTLRQLTAQKNLHLLDSTPEKIVKELFPHGKKQSTDAVIVSDVFARKYKVKAGGEITLVTGSGEYKLKVLSRYRDYTTELGVVLMDESLMKKIFGTYQPQSLGLYLHDPANTQEVRASLLEQFARTGELLVFSNAELRGKILDIFDQTFAVTYILRAIALIVAGLGIFQTLTVLTTERTRELGILRATGLSSRQLGGLVFTEAALMGLAAGVLGILAGIILSFILCYVINLAFFRWTIEWSLPLGILLGTLPAVLAVACAAAWLPARRAAKLKIIDCIKSV